MKKGQIIEIQWLDSVSDMRTWIFENEFDFESHDEAMLYKSVGYFIKKTQTATYICESMRAHSINGGSNLGHLFSIPNKAILQITILK